MATPSAEPSAPAAPLTFGLNHIALHVRSVSEAVRFWTTVLGARVYSFDETRDPTAGRQFAVDLGGVPLAFFEKPGLAGWETEFPHYAFTVTTESMLAAKARLDAAGVITHAIWTRHKDEALMYFRDPSGNLFELYCPHFDGADQLPVAENAGGDFTPPIAGLRYDWQG
jgi:catechol 2,3-dioxygenase-like lactoylglutathione lyase family enzyme